MNPKRLATAPAQSAEELTLRPYRDGDDQKIVDAFNLIFRAHRSLESWIWKFRDNPYLPPTLGLAWNKEGKVVGHYGLIPVMLNFGGTPLLIGQSVDSMVRSDYRNRGLFLQTAQVCYEQCRSRNVKAVYGFPNQAGFPGRIRHLSWRRMGFFAQYTFKTSIRSSLDKVLPFNFMSGLFDTVFRIGRALYLAAACRFARRNLAPSEYQESGTVPAGYGKLWDEVKSHEILSLWKDEKYVSWRYDRNPDHTFQYCFLKAGDDIVALAVVNFENSMAKICELFVRDRNVEYGRYLALKICRRYLAAGANRVVFSGMDFGFYPEVFSRFSRKTEFGRVFCGSVLSEKNLDSIFYEGSSWSTTLGDSDEI